MTGDLRQAFRMLVREPGFSAVVIVTVGIGIGAVTAMFAALWGVVLRPLPFPEPERLIQVQAVTDRGTPNSLSALDYFDYREGVHAFSSTAAQYIFAAIALLLSATGLYGVTASHVALSHRSIGIRMALGAAGQAMGRVFARAGVMAGSGLVVGLAISLASTRAIQGMLFEVGPAEPAVYLVVSVVLSLVVLAACAVPAWRAATVDPAEALRYE